MNRKRHPKGSRDGGRFAPDMRGKTAPTAAAKVPTLPAYPVTVTRDESSRLMVGTDGRVYRKQYDEHGVGVGSVPGGDRSLA